MSSPGPNAAPHFVLKRGHRGRYRFTFITEDATLSGDVRVASNVTDREQADRLVRRKIRDLADVFALWMENGADDGDREAPARPEPGIAPRTDGGAGDGLLHK